MVRGHPSQRGEAGIGAQPHHRSDRQQACELGQDIERRGGAQEGRQDDDRRHGGDETGSETVKPPPRATASGVHRSQTRGTTRVA